MRATNILVVTLLALLAFVVAQDSDTQDEEWTVDANNESPVNDTEPSNDDVPSRERRSTTCGTIHKLSASDKRIVIREHNRLRRLEGASNMLALKWSDELANRAHQWASKCIWNHGMTKDCNNRPLGQNLYLVRQGGGSSKINMARVIGSSWFSEKKYYNYDTHKCRVKKCGHYEEIVRATRYEVGCSIARCPFVMNGLRKWHNAVIVACDYRYKDIDGLPRYFPYMKGAACSKCDKMVKRAYKCKNNLCYDCDVTKESGCKCASMKCSHGKFNRKLCKCICSKGYWGRLCKKPCVCKNTMNNCEQFKSFCHHPNFIDFMQEKCSETCPEHCQGTPPAECR